VEHPNSKGYGSLEFAQIESEAIARIFSNNKRIRSEQATKNITTKKRQSQLY
jgi:hypothetical protein